MIQNIRNREPAWLVYDGEEIIAVVNVPGIVEGLKYRPVNHAHATKAIRSGTPLMKGCSQKVRERLGRYAPIQR